MIPPVDIAHIVRETRRLCARLDDGPGEPAAEPTQGPSAPCRELQLGLAALERFGAGAGAPAPPLEGANAGEISRVGNACIERLAHLSGLAGRRHPSQLARRIERLTLPLACWIIRRGGELTQLAPIVNAASALANATRDPDALAALYELMSEVADGLSPEVTRPSGPPDPAHPWRVLLLNRAIVATRSHRPDLMEAAFKAIIDVLPADAPRFFREAMGQMEALNYPPEVRAVVERYASAWRTPHVLH